MQFFQNLFRPVPLTSAEKQRRGAQLDAKRKHLRGQMSQTTGEIRRAWTSYRTWRGTDADKKKLRSRIKHLEAVRKQQTKEMVKLAAEMKKLGYQAAAGYVEIS